MSGPFITPKTNIDASQYFSLGNGFIGMFITSFFIKSLWVLFSAACCKKTLRDAEAGEYTLIPRQLAAG
ncbi:MAG: hypothetical protein KUG71_01315 [Porticoccaceae bacterium]|nr:hypothetical protein [Porticoccaceae bacterium]